MKLNVNIIESNKQIKDLILNNIKDTMTKIVNKAIPAINSSVKSIVKNALVGEPEYGSLLSGTLKAEFGIPNSSVVDSIVDALVDTLNIEASPITISRNGIAGGFSLTMMKSDDMNGLVYTDLASVHDAKGYSLPWLEWLLYEKNNPIVKRYNVSYTDSPYSRSGMAIMVPSTGNWRVPPMYAGSIRNNWTTRAISKTEKQIYNTIISNVEAKL